jgi:hypothetical protein
MNKSYDVYMCRKPKQVSRAPINNYAPLEKYKFLHSPFSNKKGA